jgi:hypothetical protein
MSFLICARKVLQSVPEQCFICPESVGVDLWRGKPRTMGSGPVLGLARGLDRLFGARPEPTFEAAFTPAGV